MDVSDEFKMLSCPFCGGEADLVKRVPMRGSGITSDYVVQCRGCEAMQFTQPGKEDEPFSAVEAWNRRVNPWAKSGGPFD